MRALTPLKFIVETEHQDDGAVVAREAGGRFAVSARLHSDRPGDGRVWLDVEYRAERMIPPRCVTVANRRDFEAFILAAADRFESNPQETKVRDAAYEIIDSLVAHAVADLHVSFAPGTPTVAEAKETAALPWRTAREVASATPERPDWLAEPYLVRGEVTGIAGKLKVGKSTLTAHLMRAVLTGGTFLGQPCQRGPVLFLTEQRPGTLRELFERVGLTDRDDLHVLHLHDTAGTPWPQVAASAVMKARAEGAILLVVDTISRFARIADENDAAAMAAALTPVEDAAKAGIGVWVPHHERKSGGSVEDAGRGSTAFGGAVDILLRLKRGEGNTPRTVRILQALSRFDATPEDIAVELVNGEYIMRGTESAVRRHQAREEVDAVLTGASLMSAGPMTLATLKERLPDAKDDTLRKALEDSVRDGHAVREGTGRRGSPYTWRTVDSFATPITGVQKQNKRHMEDIDAARAQAPKAKQRRHKTAKRRRN